MRSFIFCLLFFCLTVQCFAEGNIYTDSDLKPEPPMYSRSSFPPQPTPQFRQSSDRQSSTIYREYRTYEEHPPTAQPHYKQNSQPQKSSTYAVYSKPSADNSRSQPIATGSYSAYSRSIDRMIAETFARATLFMLIVYGVPFILGLICLIDILRNEFAGNNKLIWLLVVLFLPLVGAALYFFIGTDQKVRPEDDEEPVVRLI